MKDYRQLAIRYLKSNKKRTFLTILGASLSTMILFAFLNSVMSLYVTYEETLKKMPDELMIAALVVLLISYIFAIFSVAVVRNSIQLISLEQIRDYGVLRCVGSTKKQLKEVVFWMGFLLEMNGILLGIVLGFLLYLPIAIKANLDIGFHFIVVPFIIVVFLFDLYFVMQENCKFVNRLTPIAAVRGEFKINKSKIKARRKGLVGLILGVEGDYAMKNLKRNPSRMWKTVGVMAMGIMMVTVSVSLCGTIYSYVTGDMKQYGRYQISDYSEWEPGLGLIRSLDWKLASHNAYILQNSECVTEYKPVYEASIYTQDPLELYHHLDGVYEEETAYGSTISSLGESYINGEETTGERGEILREFFISGNRLVGYDPEDYERLRGNLIAGTMELSENGILLVNGTRAYNEMMDTINPVWKDYMITDYQVGDTIEMVDFKAMTKLVESRLTQEGLLAAVKNGSCDSDRAEKILYECYKELAEAGVTRTYVIEGIVGIDANRVTIYADKPAFVLPLNRYFEETGLNTSNSSGIMYHIEGMRISKEIEQMAYTSESLNDLSYVYVLITLGNVWDLMIGAGLFVLFLFVVNMLNVINTTASDLYLRRKEFAQLRVMGMSKKRLIYMVMLESVIVAVLSGVIGVVVAFFALKKAIEFVNIGFYVPFEFSWVACVGMVAFCTVLICMTVYIPIKKMKMSVAEELMASGE